MSDAERRRHASPARRGWMAGLTQFPPSGVGSTFPNWARFVTYTLTTVGLGAALGVILYAVAG